MARKFLNGIIDISAAGHTEVQAATQDGMQLLGRAGGSSSFLATITPGVLTSSITLTTPLVSGTLATGAAAANQVAVWSGTNQLIGSTSLTATTTSGALLLSLASGTTTATAQTLGNSNTITSTGAVTAAAVITALYSGTVGTPGSASSGYYAGLWSNPSISNANNTFAVGSYLIGNYVTPTFTTSNTSGTFVLNNLYGEYLSITANSTNATSTNTLFNVFGYYVGLTSAASGGGGLTITNYYGLYLAAPALTTTTITNRYGVYQGDSSALNVFYGTQSLFGAGGALAAGAITHQGAGGITTIQASTQDGVKLLGRAGGTSSFFATITPGVLTSSITLTSPLASGTITTGSGAANQVAVWSGTNALTGGATFTATTTSGALLVVTAAGTSTATTVTTGYASSITFTGAITGSSVMAGDGSSVTATPGSAATGNYVGGTFSVTGTSAANVFLAASSLIGIYSNPIFATANTSGATVLASLIGVEALTNISSSNATATNTITNVYGFYNAPVTWVASGGGGLTITNAYGLYLSTITLTTATITNRYGIYQQDPAAFNIYAGSAHTFGLTTVTAGAISHLGTAGIKTIQAATQDGVQLLGRAGGSSSFFATITPGVLTSSITLTSPLASGTLTTGSGAANQVATWSGTNALTGSASWTATTTSGALLVSLASGTSTATTQTFGNANSITFTGALSGSAVVTSLYSGTVGTPGSAASGYYTGAYLAPSITSAANTNASGSFLIGTYVTPTFATANTSGAQVLATLIGSYIVLTATTTNASSTNTIANAYGHYAILQSTASGGGGLTITNYYGIYLATASLTTTTITNRYGVYQQDPAATNVFAGTTTVGSSSFTNTTALSALTVSPTFTGAITGSALMTAISVSPTATPGSAATAWYVGVNIAPTISSAANTNAGTSLLFGALITPQFSTSNTSGATVLSQLYGVDVANTVTSTNASGTNTVMNVIGFNANLTASASGGGGLTITNYYGLFLATALLTTATITNRFGVYQVDPAATNVFAGTTSVAASSFTNTTALNAFSSNPTFTGAVTGNVYMAAIYAGGVATPTSASVASYTGAYISPSVTSAANVFAAGSTLIGAFVNPTFATANTTGAAVLGEMVGSWVQPVITTTNATGTNSIASVFGYYVKLFATSSGGGGLTITNYYGLYLDIPSLTTATTTNRYGIYCADTSCKNLLGGNFFSVFGAAGSAQSTGWGTPAGPAVVATFPATPTLGQCGQAIGEIIVVMKALGFFGA